MADATMRDGQVGRAEAGHRKAFVVGTLLGAGAGVVSAFLHAPRSGRATRAEIQQGIEGVLFKVLDMRPSRPQPDLSNATITLIPAAPPQVAASDQLVDVVIDGPRPSDLHA